MNQRGVIPIGLILYAIAAVAVVGALWWVVDTWRDGRAAVREVDAIKVEVFPGCRKDTALECVKELKDAYAAFVAETKRLGEEAQKKAAAEIERQKEVTKERSASYEKRLASINAAYRGLRDGRADSGGSPMPAVPDTARPTDDGARDNRLLDLLQHAEKQTGQLIELQEWVREQRQAK